MEEILDLIEGLSKVDEDNFIEKLRFIEESLMRIRHLLKEQVTGKRTITIEDAHFIEAKFNAASSYLESIYEKVLKN